MLAAIPDDSLGKRQRVAANTPEAAFGLRALHVDDDTHQAAPLVFILYSDFELLVDLAGAGRHRVEFTWHTSLHAGRPERAGATAHHPSIYCNIQ